MFDQRAVIRHRRPLSILLLFAVAFLVQGMSIAVFHADRHVRPLAKSSSAFSNVYTVTTGLDDGPGSLRDAIKQANENPGPDLIVIDVRNVITLTLGSPLELTDAVSIQPIGHHFTDVVIYPIPTVDASDVVGSVFQLTNHANTHLDGLRIINAQSGYGISATNVFTATINNVDVENSMGGIQVGFTNAMTVTNVALFDIAGTGVEVKQSHHVRFDRLVVSNIGSTGIHVSDGVSDMGIFSSTISEVFDEFGAGISLAGNPAPTGIVMRGNTFTGTFDAIYFGPGANYNFPAPEVLTATQTISGTVKVSLRSPADPFSYTYPLSIDLYRVSADGSYSPLRASTMYDQAMYPNAITETIPVSFGALSEDDLITAIATTANPNTSDFAVPVALTIPPPDSDGDGVVDDDDQCPATVIPESAVPLESLGVNRFALVDDDLVFDTVLPEGEGPDRSYTTTETAGCSCEQIIDELDLGSGHAKFGCSISAMDSWIAAVEAAAGKDAAYASVFETPETFVLEQNYPNPFNPVTAITFDLPEPQRVVLRVFDVMGRMVATLVDTEMNQGKHRVMWNGRNAHGQSVASGLYIYRIEAGDFTAERMMSLLR